MPSSCPFDWQVTFPEAQVASTQVEVIYDEFPFDFFSVVRYPRSAPSLTRCEVGLSFLPLSFSECLMHVQGHGCHLHVQGLVF